MAYTQDERMCQVSSPLGDNVLLLTELNAQESISQPFFFDLQLLSEKDDVNFGSLIGKPISVRTKLANGTERHFHGICSRLSQGASVGDFTAYRAEVVPFLWLLRRRTGCRIFQHKSTPDIIKAILAETGFSDYEFQLSGEHSEHEYCVQFRESDLQFISRLSEEEGIAYFFKHSEKAHTLVFFDSPSANAPCPGQKSCVYGAAKEMSGPGGVVTNWRHEYELAVGKVALTDYNFEDPSMSLHASAQTARPMGGNEKLEVYQFPGEYTTLAEGERRAKLRMQAEEAAAVCARAQTSCAAFTPGFRFDLKGHYRGDYNGAYLITSVQHRASQDVGDGGRENSYVNEITCMPYSVPYRPLLRTPKPLIYGVQTATVVGASGKEIDVDSHGRVVVQFHWDREGKKNENSSCRVRVSQNWAGKGWGLVANPRIGQEVIVEFIDGDPNRPIIIGRVYNGEQTMGFGVPASDTQTGFISRSSPGGSAENANIWRFEDKKGAEHIYLHAEKDNLVEVENDETQEVGRDRKRAVKHDETISIGNDRTTTIDNDEIHDVKKSRTRSVGGDEQVKVDGNRKIMVKLDHEETIDANETLSVGKDRGRNVNGNETVGIKKDQTLTIEGGRSLTVNKTHAIQVREDQEEKVGGRFQQSVTKEYILQAKKIQITAEDEVSIKAGSAEIVMKSSGDITVNGKKIKVEGKGDLVFKGSKIAGN